MDPIIPLAQKTNSIRAILYYFFLPYSSLNFLSSLRLFQMKKIICLKKNLHQKLTCSRHLYCHLKSTLMLLQKYLVIFFHYFMKLLSTKHFFQTSYLLFQLLKTVFFSFITVS